AAYLSASFSTQGNYFQPFPCLAPPRPNRSEELSLHRCEEANSTDFLTKNNREMKNNLRIVEMLP
ncbi:hypothetical protein ACUNV4_29985, partial [Granulosicoccus sp. 3-233]|uniref:hypothetical protein n=1 Tax=Granulosicoccus sp. 3-233 TaxID=3417969 RepID=UPI003D328986